MDIAEEPVWLPVGHIPYRVTTLPGFGQVGGGYCPTLDAP